ncbi:histidine kinase [Hymenobacter sp. 15J16-1T3B]|uniref:sensor histidine kinase n=1 Tax=Hymenobacter sp. 15J16-1T3B TaxID=2886941 RepID=UPI001D0F4D47|nr:sensor histidine kinase [Hymenobacter sp. 15J16-1T3B]MCC3158729.1 histidine kinase [Hymenobacter sp. 15J16-1T3B]
MMTSLFGPRLARHLGVWLLLVGGLAWASWADSTNAAELLGYLTYTLGTLALAVYAHYWVLTRLFDQRRYAWYLLGAAAVLLGGAGLLYGAEHNIGFSVTGAGKTEPEALGTYAQDVLNVGLVLLAATVARYVRRGIVSHYQVQQLRALQLETELSLLKAQVNQHFLFNTLNNLYGLSLAAPEQMPEALMQLAGLMRYQLDSSRQAHVTVGTEAEYLANYIGLEKLRLRDNTRVEFVAELPHPERPVAPLLLLPLVENCFKHAIGPSGPNTIRIVLTQTDAGLTLRTDNSIPPHFRPAPSGLGLPTLRRRLTQFYPGPRHQLTVEATATRYAATLTLVG